MTDFETRAVTQPADAVAPDGSEVRILTSLAAGSMAHFSLAGHATSVAVRHRTVGELWYFVSGTGEMWRSGPDHSEVTSCCRGRQHLDPGRHLVPVPVDHRRSPRRRRRDDAAVAGGG